MAPREKSFKNRTESITNLICTLYLTCAKPKEMDEGEALKAHEKGNEVGGYDKLFCGMLRCHGNVDKFNINVFFAMNRTAAVHRK